MTTLEGVISGALKEASDREKGLARRDSDVTLLSKEAGNGDSPHRCGTNTGGHRTTGEDTAEPGTHGVSVITAYRTKISLNIKMRMFYASLVALALQWGTTGSSILIAYLTPTLGLGCRSVSYLAYGCMATTAWLCLVGSMLLSHEVMVRYQSMYQPGVKIQNQSRSWVHSLCLFAAGLLRIAGKGLASINALWLITSSLLEITGAYDNCWCNGVYLRRHGKGFVTLFKNASQLERAAKLSWGGGLALTLIICLVVFAFCFCGSKKNKGT